MIKQTLFFSTPVCLSLKNSQLVISWKDSDELWFDVGIKRYTTREFTTTHALALWFDVGIKRYTTHNLYAFH